MSVRLLNEWIFSFLGKKPYGHRTQKTDFIYLRQQ